MILTIPDESQEGASGGLLPGVSSPGAIPEVETHCQPDLNLDNLTSGLNQSIGLSGQDINRDGIPGKASVI